ncbi:DUF1127 domain-containing protein [Aureimonas sp. ME7]|uniref:DUF1127 domain-containing protein n=1 Tax=Aureimonas sp. ME7 TaxID=2744252 RepID=UPI0015F43828|nr:DUF1127 domain-containing protein [Aureimonas sp. ME7]
MLSHLRSALDLHRRRRRNLAALHHLTDRQLADIGLVRCGNDAFVLRRGEP